jgi:surface antigen
MLLKTIVPATLALALLAGCANTKDSAGAAGGDAGVIGSRLGGGSGKLASSGVGTLLGAFIGRDIARSLDKADLTEAENAARRAYAGPVGEWVQWRNPQSGNSGSIIATREGYTNAGTYCREYRQTVTAGGKTELAYGTACKQADGAWKIVTNS